MKTLKEVSGLLLGITIMLSIGVAAMLHNNKIVKNSISLENPKEEEEEEIKYKITFQVIYSPQLIDTMTIVSKKPLYLYYYRGTAIVGNKKCLYEGHFKSIAPIRVLKNEEIIN